MDVDDARELAKKDPAAATAAMKEKMGLLHSVPPPPPEEPEGGWAKQQNEIMFRSDVDLEKQKQLVRRVAKKELDAEELEAAASNSIIVERATPLGAAIFALPDTTPTVWGDGQRVAWAKGQTLMLAAKQGLGKSTLAQNLFLRRIGVLSDEFLGMPVDVPAEGKALYLGMDRPPQILGSMRRMVESEHADLLNKRAVFWPGPLPPKLVEDPDAFALWVLERAPGCHTVVFDSVKDITVGISKDEVGAQINALFQVLLVHGMEVVAVHHQRKGGSDDKDKVSSLDDIYGSVHLTNGAGSIFTIDGKPGDARVSMRHLKSALEMFEEFDLLIDFGTGQMLKSDAPVYTVGGVLIAAGLDGISVNEIAQKVYNQDIKKTRADVRAKLKDLAGAQKLPPVPGLGASQPERWRYVNTAPPVTDGGQKNWGAGGVLDNL